MTAWREKYPGVEELKVAVMGCVVNGPGESKHADIGISLPGTGEDPRAPSTWTASSWSRSRASTSRRTSTHARRVRREALGQPGLALQRREHVLRERGERRIARAHDEHEIALALRPRGAR